MLAKSFLLALDWDSQAYEVPIRASLPAAIFSLLPSTGRVKPD
jgi:hypothetical protein